MERTVLTISAANIVTVNLMVFVMGIGIALFVRFLKGRSDA